MALRGHPRISKATIQRVRETAAACGYRTNPLLRSVMEHVRSAHGQHSWLNVAFVWLEATPKSAKTDPLQRQTIAAVRLRAEQVGIKVEPFYLSEDGMTSKRLEQILVARGISGIIFSPSTHIPVVDLRMTWSQFSIVVIGNTAWQPEFHRAAHHHYRGMARALAEVKRLGFRRPGIIVRTELNERAARTPEAAFVAYAPATPTPSRMIYRFDASINRAALTRWLAKARPDCLVFPFTAEFEERFGSLEIIRSIPRLGLDLFEPGPLAGIAQNFGDIGGNAVDLLMTQLLHNDRGAPNRAKVVLAEGEWQEGPSLSVRKTR